jgi:CRP-like cAMP-binding protein
MEEELIYEMLSIGILKTYKKNEQIFKKYSYPEYYYMVIIGEVLQPNMPYEFKPGKFFGEKNIINNSKYRIIPYSNSDNTVLLLIPKDFFLLKLKNKIIDGNDKIRQMIFSSFKIFSMIERKVYEKFYLKMEKLLPSFGEIIVSNEEIANSIFLIYNGNCIISNEKEGDILILQKGDIFGNESLNNFCENGKMLNNKYTYTIINNSESSIIFRFIVTDLTKYIINGMKAYLSDYFSKREEIIKQFYKRKKFIQNNYKKDYDIFKTLSKKQDIINNIITVDTIEKSFSNILSEIRLNKETINSRKRIITKMSKGINKKKITKSIIKKYLQNEKNKSRIYSQAKFSSINATKRKISENSIISPERKKRTIFWFSEERKNDRKRGINKSKFKNNININQHFNLSSKVLTTSDNNDIYLTSVNHENIFNTINNAPIHNRNKTFLSPIRQMDSKDNKEITNTDITHSHNKASKRFINSAFSSNRFSTSYKSSSNFMSTRDQVEAYGITVLDTMSYFNDGVNERIFKRNYSDKNRNINQRTNIFYKTRKYNIPLYILCNLKERKKFPKIANF